MALKVDLDGHRGQFHRQAIEALLRGEKVMPIYIDCSLTKKCSYDCIYCFSHKAQRNVVRDLSYKVIMDFLDDCKDIGVKAISFVSDGESTCNKHLYSAILKCKENNIDCSLGTNGYLLRRDRLEEILKILVYLRFNISGVSRYAEIHGCKPNCFDIVIGTIQECVRIKQSNNLPVTIGLQMVLMPEIADQVIPLSQLAKQLKVDYLVIKHCTDSEDSKLGINYGKYEALIPLLKQAESMSDDNTQIVIKWSKILTGNKRKYTQCWAGALIHQISGNGICSICGSFFGKGYEKYQYGNINDMRFKDIVNSTEYWNVIEHLRSDCFNAKNECATLCLHDKINEFIYDLQNGAAKFEDNIEELPYGGNFL